MGRVVFRAAAIIAVMLFSLLVTAPPGSAEGPVVRDDAVTLVVGDVHTFPVPGVLANDDPVPSGLRPYFLTTPDSVSSIYQYEMNGDGSFRIGTVGEGVPPGAYELRYCLVGPGGLPCVSNEARIVVTVVAPVVRDDAVTLVVGDVHTFPAPGVLANDDPVPTGLRPYFLTTPDSVSSIYQYEMNGDGSFRIGTVGEGVPPGVYELRYCLVGPGGLPPCVSNEARIVVTVTAPPTDSGGTPTPTESGSTPPPTESGASGGDPVPSAATAPPPVTARQAESTVAATTADSLAATGAGLSALAGGAALTIVGGLVLLGLGGAAGRTTSGLSRSAGRHTRQR